MYPVAVPLNAHASIVQVSLYTYVVHRVRTCTCVLYTCLGSSVGKSICLEHKRSWVLRLQVPSEAAHLKNDCLGLSCVVLPCLSRHLIT